MLSNPEFLSECYGLWKLGLSFPLIPGTRIGRGFADVGYEEYSVLNEKKAVSLLVGTVIELDEFYLNYYFLIPTVDQIFNEIYSRGWDLIECRWQDQRDWHLSAEQSTKSCKESCIVSVTGKTLLSASALLLTKILNQIKSEHVQS